MERWTALLPDRLPNQSPTNPFSKHYPPRLPRIGKLVESVYLSILEHLPIPDLPQFALVSKQCHRLSFGRGSHRVWKSKLERLDFRGPGEIEWRINREAKTVTTKDGEIEDERYRDDIEDEETTRIGTTSPAVSSNGGGGGGGDSEFGDFFDGRESTSFPEGGVSSSVRPLTTTTNDTGDDGFGDFHDGDNDDDGFGLEDGFSQIGLGGGSTSTTTKKKANDDLLLMFDDDEDDLTTTIPPPSSSTKLSRPPAQSNLTFETRPTLPSPSDLSSTTANSSSTRPSAFAFNPSSSTTTNPTGLVNEIDYLSIFKKYHSILLPYYTSLQTHTTSSLVFTTSSLSSMSRAKLLSTLSRFCHPLIAPTRSLPQRLTVLRNVQSSIDFYESTLLAEFERADSAVGGGMGMKRDEEGMKEKAKVLWELNGKEEVFASSGGVGVGGGTSSSSSLKEIFVQKREMLFEANHHDPLRNLTKIETPSEGEADGIDFSAMDSYMSSILSILTSEGSLIARVFPPESDVLIYFLERLANDVVSEYITTLLSAAQGLQHPLFLLATAATFGQVYRLVETVLEIEPRNERFVTKERCEDVVFRMFEPLMDDYLTEEGEWIRQVLVGMCDEWDKKTASDLAISDPTFLASQNPAQVKKNVLAGFTKVLLLPVTIIPKTASYGFNALTYGATGAFNTFAQLGGAALSTSQSKAGGGGTTTTPSVSTPTIEPPSFVGAPIETLASAWGDEGGGGGAVGGALPRLSIDANGTISGLDDVSDAEPPLSARYATTTATTPIRAPSHFDRMQLLLSLDTALQLIQADRDSLKRIQTFDRYPGTYGRKVRDAIEEVFIVLLQVLGENHVVPAFRQAIHQMESFKPEDQGDSDEVAPLVQFFELVHIGDTIQQMVDVYFEKEMATYIDKKDFLNTVVREKKKFESSLDDAVAQGLNAAVNILMSQVEHVLTTGQGPTDFAPADDADLDLKPTKTAKDVVSTLTRHCDMLKGSTDKHILEVFNQEVGIRLHGILLKHLKRIIVSTVGGLQLIADLNLYHSFVTTLRQPQVTAYFTSLKMVGEIYIVDSPKDLGALVRDTSRYEGTLSPDDLYELVQRRADWRKIDKQVEKQLFGLKLADDCTIS